MKVNTSGLNMKAIKDEYERLTSIHVSLTSQLDDDEYTKFCNQCFGESLGLLVEQNFGIDKDLFVYEAVQELHEILNAFSIEIGVWEVLYLKLGQILGSDDPQVNDIYTSNQTIH